MKAKNHTAGHAVKVKARFVTRDTSRESWLQALRSVHYADEWSMAFPIPSHLPRKVTPQDASSQILSKISSASAKSLNAEAAASWVSELDQAILESKERSAFGFCRPCTNLPTGQNTRADKCGPSTVRATACILGGSARAFRRVYSKRG